MRNSYDRKIGISNLPPECLRLMLLCTRLYYDDTRIHSKWWDGWPLCLSPYGVMAWFRRTGKRKLSYQSTKERVADETVRTTEGSLYSPARGSSLLIFYLQGLRTNWLLWGGRNKAVSLPTARPLTKSVLLTSFYRDGVSTSDRS